MGYTCRRCGEYHDELPFSFHAPAPDAWLPEHEDDPDSELDEETCIIAPDHFFIHGVLSIPVRDTGEDFGWGVWVSLSAASFQRALELWHTEGREQEPPAFGWLTTRLPLYEPSTLNLKTHVHTQPVGTRPRIELEPTDHPLAAEQREGITLERVEEIASRLLHQS